jgi:hypothetical protein
MIDRDYSTFAIHLDYQIFNFRLCRSHHVRL